MIMRGLTLGFYALVCLQVILTEVYSIGFRRSFFDDDDLSSIAEHDVIYAFQAPALYIRGGSAKISGWSNETDWKRERRRV